MKRRSKPHGRVNLKSHRAAFEHALKCFGISMKGHPRSSKNNKFTHDKYGHCIRQFAILELESGGFFKAEFSCTRGFRFGGLEMGVLWKHVLPAEPESIRHLPYRLQAYRDKLHAWNTAANQPLTFGSFNLLLAALSYDVAANL